MATRCSSPPLRLDISRGDQLRYAQPVDQILEDTALISFVQQATYNA